MSIKINLDAEIKTFDGNPIVYPNGSGWETVLKYIQDSRKLLALGNHEQVTSILASIERELAKPLTVKTAIMQACMNDIPEEKSETAEKKFERMRLAERVHAGGTIDLDIKDAAFIQDRAVKIWPTFIAYRVHQALEGK